jgi:hypothetical protein
VEEQLKIAGAAYTSRYLRADDQAGIEPVSVHRTFIALESTAAHATKFFVDEFDRQREEVEAFVQRRK